MNILIIRICFVGFSSQNKLNNQKKFRIYGIDNLTLLFKKLKKKTKYFKKV